MIMRAGAVMTSLFALQSLCYGSYVLFYLGFMLRFSLLTGVLLCACYFLVTFTLLVQWSCTIMGTILDTSCVWFGVLSIYLGVTKTNLFYVAVELDLRCLKLL